MRPLHLPAALLATLALLSVANVAFQDAAAAQLSDQAAPGGRHGALAPGTTEEEWFAEETATLGLEHALEHARGRAAAARIQAAQADATRVPPADSPPRDDRQARARRLPSAQAAPEVTGDPALVGRWTQAPFDLPLMAINAVVLATGKVLLFSYPRRDFANVDYGAATLWNPALGTGATAFTNVPPPIDPDTGRPANLFCAGQTLLSDGRVLVAGGNRAYENATNPNYAGLRRAYLFDPVTETWSEQPRMRQGRWYPTLLRMGDGRVAVASGLNERQDGGVNRDLEVFTPPAAGAAQGRFDLVGGPDALGSAGQPPSLSLYPQMFWLRSGRGLVAGPSPSDTWFLDAPGVDSSLVWEDARNLSRQRTYGTAVPLPGGPRGPSQVLLAGGFGADRASTATTERFDERTPADGWTPAEPLVTARSNHNTKLLPDGSLVTIGGGVGADLWTATDAQRAVELWNPATGHWHTGPSQQEFRAYHSTAVLLPDGRVLSAGDDVNTSPDPLTGQPRNGNLVDTAEIYSPPYLFRGPRPSITAAPRHLAFGSTFTVRFRVHPGAEPVQRAVLVAPSAVTHSVDMNQRHVELTVVRQAARFVRLQAPPNANAAPSGPYMLFLLDAKGVPSVARFVSVQPV